MIYNDKIYKKIYIYICLFIWYYLQKPQLHLLPRPELKDCLENVLGALPAGGTRSKWHGDQFVNPKNNMDHGTHIFVTKINLEPKYGGLEEELFFPCLIGWYYSVPGYFSRMYCCPPKMRKLKNPPWWTEELNKLNSKTLKGLKKETLLGGKNHTPGFLGHWQAWAEDRRNLEGMEHNLRKVGILTEMQQHNDGDFQPHVSTGTICWRQDKGWWPGSLSIHEVGKYT